MRRAVIFGAGSVGRGFLGQLLCEAGWTVTFLDVSRELVDALNRDGGYPHVTIAGAARTRARIAPVAALDARDVVAAVEALASADLAATSVGARALPAVADTLARAVERRIALGRPALNVLLAENVHGCAALMSALLTERLPLLAPEQLAASLGLVETSIGRMIPALEPAVAASEPGLVFAEEYKLLPFDGAAVVGEPLQVPGLVFDRAVPFAYYGDRKLYVHNLGHCFTANLGLLCGDELVSDSVGRIGVRYLVRAAMIESAVALAARHRVPPGPLLDHVDDLLHRFGNRALGDTNARVARDPERKLARDDRLLGAFRLAIAEGVPAGHLSLAVASGAAQLARQGWAHARVWAHLETGLDDLDTVPWALLRAQVTALADGFDFAAQLDLIEQTYEPSRVI